MASPIDPRLIRLVPPVRGLILRTGITQALSSLLVVARGVLIGTLAASAVTGSAPPGTGFTALFVALVFVVVAHGLVSWTANRLANASVGDIVDQLRVRAMEALAARDPREVEEESARWRHILTRGLGDFRPFLTEFLPALVATAVGTPLALAVVFYYDWISGVICVLTLPLIPFFMVLIGRLTADHTRRRLEVTSGLGNQLADLLAGAPTLRAVGDPARAGQQILASGRRHEKATMGVLRLAFLSAFALEFIATLSVAVVAVSIGLRLVVGDMALLPGLVVLIIVPEVFNPVRAIGASYHAAADGVEAADAVLSLIDDTTTSALNPSGYLVSGSPGIEIRNLSVAGRDGVRPAGLNATARPGALTVLTGPNGSGKSTALLAALGALPEESVTGTISIGGEITYLPARPALERGTVGSNLALFSEVDATRLSASPGVIPGAPGTELVGLDASHAVAADGSGISAGQRQRIGLSRVLHAARTEGKTIVLLDEPTAHLSPELVERVVDEIRSLADSGCAVLTASHDRRLTAAADEVVEL